ncbi:hypothetical protein E2C01_056966 [Portunus trituberculatus]|uniref:Uncharacterized protein n=1 Tax=Portunus trituberculatus TaxID=210409 RepID=A0A5B7GZ33_PORTR|nr:hypothetical protein [Portunus trituberculatus]
MALVTHQGFLASVYTPDGSSGNTLSLSQGGTRRQVNSSSTPECQRALGFAPVTPHRSSVNRDATFSHSRSNTAPQTDRSATRTPRRHHKRQ